jgi:hypothetical protein
MSFCEVKPPEQVWYDCEREGEQQSGMTQRDGPLSVAKPGGLGDSAAVIAFQPAECVWGAQGSPGAPHTSASLTADLAAIGAINCYDTGTRRYIPLIVWKATELVSEG